MGYSSLVHFHFIMYTLKLFNTICLKIISMGYEAFMLYCFVVFIPAHFREFMLIKAHVNK